MAAKVLVFLGGFLFVSTVFVGLYSIDNEKLLEGMAVTFRSGLASVFGFVLSSNIKNSNRINTDHKKDIIKEKELFVTENCKAEVKRHNNYYYDDGNLVQVLIALVITLLCGAILLTIFIKDMPYDGAVVSQLRDLMCTSIGFLLGESKIKSDK
ncbi:MAG: hypothetical protein RSE45_03965 [Bacilli bacterium]